MQKIIPHLWFDTQVLEAAKLSFVKEAEACGWVKDQFGLSWQIIPRIMSELLSNGTKQKIKRVTEAFLKMKKFDIAALERARKDEV